jgi:hypothetical protein
VSSGLVDTKPAYVQDRWVGAVTSPPAGAPEFHCAPMGLEALRSQWGRRAHCPQHHQRECGRRLWRGIAPVVIGNASIAGNPKRPGDLGDELRVHSHLLQ